MFRSRIAMLVLFASFVGGSYARAEPVAEKYLLEGNLTGGEKALQMHLAANPKDDQARFGLGIIQLVRAFEDLGAGLHKYGFRLGEFGTTPRMREFLPTNPKPEKITYANVRQIIQTWIDGLNRSEATLAAVRDPTVKLPLHVGLIKMDPIGKGKPINAAFLLDRVEATIPRDKGEKFVVGFDRGDVSWFRGYLHFLAAWGEMLLAVDGQEMFDRTAHLFFEKVDSPYTFLQERRPKYGFLGIDENQAVSDNYGFISDLIALAHLARLPIKEPSRLKAALEHLQSMVAMAKEMWKFILAETDDDNEWIPNPRQKGVLGVAVTQEMVDTWLEVLEEIDLILQGKHLLPFWRGSDKDRGVNLRRIFLEPETFDLIFWLQGTAAVRYLEKGPLTKLADPRLGQRIEKAFGGPAFIGFAFWFN